jgi:hypothetical protein
MSWLLDRDRRLGTLVDIAENSLSVLYLAETDLQFIEPSWTVGRARGWLESNGFDAAPLAEVKPHRFFSVDVVADDHQPVSDVALPIDAARLVTSTLGLADGVALLETEPYYFVMEGSRLAGIVTRADLQRPAVSMVTLSLILAAEARMGVLIEGWVGPDWERHLTDERRAKLGEILEDRRRRNVEIGLIDCLMLGDRLKLLGKSRDLIASLGYLEPDAYRIWKEQLGGLRDSLAHGGSLLHHEPDPAKARQLFAEVRGFAEAIWSLPDALEEQA